MRYIYLCELLFLYGLSQIKLPKTITEVTYMLYFGPPLLLIQNLNIWLN